ncbi:MAG: hypothetical protein M3157_03860, partial [Actinomycetota bacterium]|nr:hypothetical protein [Actinomycetota bacterium]
MAALTSSYFDLATGVLVPLLTVLAFAISHHRREKKYLIQTLLAYGALALEAVERAKTPATANR